MQGLDAWKAAIAGRKGHSSGRISALEETVEGDTWEIQVIWKYWIGGQYVSSRIIDGILFVLNDSINLAASSNPVTEVSQRP